jgi:glycosyltransferase involved in cell wall biosynthesis
MAILILLPNLQGGGAERVMLDLAKEFSRSGHLVEFALMEATGDFLAEAERNFRVVDLSVTQMRGLVAPLARHIRLNKPDVVIANMWPLTSVSVLSRAISRCRCKLLLLEHSTLSHQYASWGKLHRLKMSLSMASTYRFADHIAAVSIGGAIDTARLAYLKASNVTVLHNPIPNRPMPSSEACSEIDSMWNCPPGLRILAVGGLKEPKNYPLLLTAFANSSWKNARLMLLGKGDKENLLRSLAIKLGIQDRLIFAGFHLDPSPFYATADLFVMSSDYEGLPTVMLEALSFGLPVVSTDCPSGPSEILENGRWGRLTPVGDSAALTCAIDEALCTPVDREVLKSRASEFSPAIATRRYLDLLDLS